MRGTAGVLSLTGVSGPTFGQAACVDCLHGLWRGQIVSVGEKPTTTGLGWTSARQYPQVGLVVSFFDLMTTLVQDDVDTVRARIRTR
jgi:hypothetical protein